ncbi:MAG: M1 family aminopeptidase [Marinilabiliales bacterium]
MNSIFIKFFIVIIIVVKVSYSQEKQFENYLPQIVRAKQKYFNEIFKLKSNTGKEYNIIYHRTHWYVNPYIREISGEVTTHFIVVDTSLSNINFDFSDTLSVDSVVYHGVNLGYTKSQDILTVILNDTLAYNTLDSLTIYYHGVPRLDNNRTFGQALQDTLNYPVPIIWTLSEPYGAKEWWPCKQSLNDKIDSIDVYITVADSFVAVSNGVLFNTTINGNLKTYHWKHRYPIAAYLVAFAVTDYRKIEWHATLQNGDSVRIENYVFPGDSADWSTKLQVIKYIQLFDSLVGTYPFYNEKYGHAQFSWLGGMEHQTIGFMVSLHPELVSHELAHQWFGDAITCGSWHEIWLNEGFATYFSGLTFEFLDTMWWDDWRIVRIDDITSQPDGSVFCDDTTNVERIFDGRLSYAKGAYLLHMIRWEIGDTAFFNAIRNYFNDTNLLYSYANTAQLKGHFENEADTNLSEFFNDWYYGQGYPQYTIYWSQGNDSVAKFKIFQSQTHPSVGFFEMHLPVRLKGPANVDTTLAFHHLYNGQEFSVKIPFQISKVDFNPELQIVTKNPQIQHLQDVTEISNVYVYPNPAHDKVCIIKPANLKINKIYIVCSDGKKMNAVNNTISQTEIILNTEILIPGLYFINLLTEYGSIYKKIVIN